MPFKLDSLISSFIANVQFVIKYDEPAKKRNRDLAESATGRGIENERAMPDFWL